MNRNARVGLISLSVVAAMTGLSFAAVPFYKLFCAKTGYGGTTMRVSEAQAATIKDSGHAITIRFDANHRDDLPWEFKPEHPTDTVSIGAKDMAIFIAKNLSDVPVTGTAIYNVTPEIVGQYFTKIQCFCFTQQTLKPGEQVRMPVIYYVDPKIMTDPNTKDIQEITLSYTFYPVDDTKKVDQGAKRS